MISAPLVAPEEDSFGVPYPGGEREEDGELDDTTGAVLSTPLVAPEDEGEAVLSTPLVVPVAVAKGTVVGRVAPTGQTVV